MNINIVSSDKHKKEENLLDLYSKLEYDRTKIKNIMGKKQYYFVITAVIFMIMMIFSIIFIIINITVLIKQKNHKNNFKHDLLKSLIYKNKYKKN